MPVRVLGIESSCDETSLAIVEDGRKILSNVVSSQIGLHERFGGVVPEIASRGHIEAIGPLLVEALDRADCRLQDLDAIATTFAPGLQGALLVGLMTAKGLAWGLDVPLVGVHHLAAHIWANRMAHHDLPLPFLCLLVSGGHTEVVRVDGPEHFRSLARTRDDAVGEAYDKTARLLGLGYPGGPAIDRLAAEGNPNAFAFPRASMSEGLDMSFSGLKTAVRRLAERHVEAGMPIPVADVAASFQRAIVDVLAHRMEKLAEQEGLEVLAVAGGVAANRELRARLATVAEKRGWTFVAPPMELCTDNAAMIAGLGTELLRVGRVATPDLAARSRYSLDALAPT
ncbi:MAG: tRNA (adenosine(37)-N6)-threonylcarbamoyltransferase complex transferase subunit TsaD [bacterium]|nr:tRNA (adenosine(37)-N6)-threonylcarbamoyltransferase complex transferase subunit TsaD [bacterium]